MTSIQSLARTLSASAAAYCPAEAERLPAPATRQERPRNVITEAERKNTAKMRAQAFEANRDDRQMGLI